jgi:diacylglycerol kinase family enzyme
MPPAARGRVVVAANPFSGRGPNAQRVAMLVGALRMRGLEPRVVWEPAERAAALAGVEPGQTVIAVGGDGTVAAVINELPPAATLAILPAGNENLFARALGFPADPVALAGGVAAGVTRAIDLGRATATAGGRTRTRLFSLMLSAGFDAEVTRRVAEWRGAGAALKRVSRRSWVRPLARSILSYRYPPLTVSADDATLGAVWCVVSNVPAYALGLRLVDGGRPDDGRLDWLACERRGLPALARYAWAARRGRLAACAGTRAGTAARVRVDGATPVPVQVDGDAWGATPVDIEVLPGALRVITWRPLT